MNPLINELAQLQELTLIHDEHKVASGGEHSSDLDGAIARMTAELPPEVRGMFERLHKKDHLFLVSVSDGGCSGCGMKLPISLIQQVKVCPVPQVCPNCSRMLFFKVGAARRTGTAQRRSEPRKVGISRFSSESLMLPRLQAVDRDGAIKELAEKMKSEGFVDSADKLVEGALQRESVISTALDHGLAFPHVRGVEGGGLTLALGLSAKGIPFDGSADKLTKIIFFMVIPVAASAFYLKLLAGLAETFMNAEARKALLAEKEADKLWKTLCKVTKATIK